MDRNLGASQVAISLTDSDAYGDLYQWGRGADGHQLRTSSTTMTPSSTDEPGHGDFILNPGTAPFDWRDPQNDNLWQGVDGTNNPCPVGFRLPTEAEWEIELASWSSDITDGAFGSPLKLVLAGLRDNFLDGLGDGHRDIMGYYWSSTVNGIDANGFSFGNGRTGGVGPGRRGLGLSVRCIKD